MSRRKIPFIKPSLPHSSELAADYEAIVESNWFTNFGPFEDRFRHAAADYLDNEAHVTTVVNATLGIDLAIKALVGVCDDEDRMMIIPSFTFAAGAEAIINNGLRPVFIDINDTDLQPNLEEARTYLEANRPSTVGILLCNIFGVGNRAIGDWEALAKEFEIPLIIDTAAGFGSRYSADEKVGARGDCEIFSLHATKPFAVGEGGLVSSRNKALIEKIRQLQNFGFGQDGKIIGVGTNAKMQEINAAIGLRQLDGFEERLRNRRAVLDIYKELLPNYRYQENDNLSTVAFVSLIAPNSRIAQQNFEQLISSGVEVRKYYEPLHFHDAIASRAVFASDLRNTEDISSRILSLPVHDDMEMDSMQYIINSIQA